MFNNFKKAESEYFVNCSKRMLPFLLGKYDTKNLPQVSSGTCGRAVVLKNLIGLKGLHYQQLKAFAILYSNMWNGYFLFLNVMSKLINLFV